VELRHSAIYMTSLRGQETFLCKHKYLFRNSQRTTFITIIKIRFSRMRYMETLVVCFKNHEQYVIFFFRNA